jgi:hypothetical protein
MPYAKSSDMSLFESLFGWLHKEDARHSAGVAHSRQHRQSLPAATQRMISFRLDADLDHRITRAMRGWPGTRSDFIRTAIERVIKEDADERLRAAHSAIRWD